MTVRRTPRRAARVAVIAPDDGVFLFGYDEEVGVHWAMPGGGLERDEAPQAVDLGYQPHVAARRG
ncbi:hypothetical protein ACFWZT_33190 [Streptomyces alboflavus]|uniref:hypothetical protein n=1 Tax=Streptomyces alboflavus TaxID=67267 RepID=UPI003673CD3E